MTPLTRDEWLARRKRVIGGTDISAILNLNPWRTPMDVWMDKTGRAEETEQNESLWFGNVFEPIVANRYAEETGKRVERYNRMLELDGHLGGNVDRLVCEQGRRPASPTGEILTDTLLEIKTSSKAPWDDIPTHYQLQVQWYLGLADSLKHADMACYFLGHGKEMKIYHIERDDETIGTLQEYARRWWRDYVEADKTPPPSNPTEAAKIWQKSGNVAIEASPDIAEAMKRIKTLSEEIKRLDGELDNAKTLVMEYMGENDTLTFQGAKLATWKSNKDSSRTAWQKVAEHFRDADEYHDVVAHFTEVKPGARVFRPAATL